MIFKRRATEPSVARNRLSRQILFIVAFPVAVQLACLMVLGHMMNDQAREVKRHFHVRSMQENMSALLGSALHTGLSVVKYKLKQDPTALAEFDEQLKGAQDAMVALETEAQDTEEEYVQKLREDFNQLETFASKARASFSTQSRLEAIGDSIHMKKQGTKLIMSLQHDVAALEQELMMRTSEHPTMLAQSASVILVFVYAISMLCLIFGFGMYYMLQRSITRRLNILNDNTVRLARSEVLHPFVRGNDEIAHLDKVFHEMANALAEAAHKERAVVQHALDVICSADAEGNFTAVSPASKNVFGFAPEELIGTKLFDLVAPADLTEAHISFSRIRDEDNEPQPFESKVVRKDGREVHILWSAYWAPFEQSMFCVAHDITDRKMAEDQLRASEARVRSIFESAPVALLVLDNNGSVKLMNPRAESMFGFRMEQLIDKSFALLVPTANEFSLDHFTQNTLEEMVGRVREMAAIGNNGRTFPIELTFDHYQTAEGDRYLAAVLDVSERHEVERLKREFVSTVSHELRTPLTAIRGSLTLLSVGALGKLGDQADKAVQIAERNCLRLINLINDLLDIEKLEAGKLEMVFEEANFAQVAERSMEAVRSFAEQYEVKFETSHASTDCKVFADSDRLVQVLVNLLSNAVKYSPKGTSVVLRSEAKTETLRVSIIDSGRGIPAEFIDKVFERFQQVETADSKKKGGTGLGLAICRAIVEQHNGKIGVDSEEGKGSTFWFEIPLVGTVGAARLAKDQPAERALIIKLGQEALGQGAGKMPALPGPEGAAVIINIAETNKVAEERS